MKNTNKITEENVFDMFDNINYANDTLHERRFFKPKKAISILKDYKELFDKKDIDFVINASYSKDHYPVSKNLLAHGFNVLCEKPFCRNEKECNDLNIKLQNLV